MRKLIILFLAAGLFIACNNDKKADRRSDRDAERDKDDYNSEDKDSKDRDSKDTDSKDRDSKDTDYKDDRDKDETTDRDNKDSDGGNWSKSDVNIFVDNCASEAVKGGMQRTKATDYCECMQRKLEVLYPNSADVGDLDVEAPNIKNMINKCLGL